MRIAVAGATGRLGSHIVDVASERGHSVVPISRGNGVDVVTGDGLSDALSGVDVIIAQAMSKAGRAFAQLDGVAVAAGPGLIGGLLVGLTTAKAIALVLEKPLMAVNHLEAHALTARLTDSTPFPYCLFLASGGHTQIVAVLGVGRYQRLGTTLDDAIGEAFDKAAKLLGLGYPGGPEIEREAAKGHATIDLPRPMLGRPEPHFSLAGLKTALR